MKTITIAPDAPALAAQRIVARLVRENLLWRHPGADAPLNLVVNNATEAIADELHTMALDGTLGGGRG